MPQSHSAYLSIGSNVGDKKENLDNAVRLIQRHDHMSVLAVSRYYRTQPQNYTDQDWFVNAALKIKTDLDPEALLAALKSLEAQIEPEGKLFRFGPRIIDLDIIYYGNLKFKSQQLEVPHPRMHERCFVLVPLCDIGPDTTHPVSGLTPDELLQNIEKQETQKVVLLDKES